MLIYSHGSNDNGKILPVATLTARLMGCVLAAVFTALSLVACGKADLSREQALGLIESSTDESIIRIRSWVLMHPENEKSLRGLGFLSENNLGTIPADSLMVQEVQKFGGVRLASEPLVGWPAFLTKDPIKVQLSVDGLALDGDQTKRVADFSWQYKELPKYSSVLAASGGTGKAVFRLYDDGWRLTEVVPIAASKDRYAVNDDLRSQIMGEIRAQSDAKAQRLKQQREEEAARRAAALEEARRLQEERRRAEEVAATARNEALMAKRAKIEAALQMGNPITVYAVSERTFTPRRRELHVFSGGFGFKWYDEKMQRYVIDRSYRFAQMSRTMILVNRARANEVQIGREGGWPSRDAGAEAAYRKLEEAYSRWQSNHREALASCAHSSSWTCADPR